MAAALIFTAILFLFSAVASSGSMEKEEYCK
jgi:hypothetical protein